MVKKLFFHDFFDFCGVEPQNEAFRVGWKYRMLRLGIVLAGGVAYAAALPPLNLSVLGMFALVPLLCYACQENWKHAVLGGFVWCMGWAIPAYWFLREIEFFVPFGVAVAQSAWIMVYAALISLLWKYTVFPQNVNKEGYIARRKFLADGGAIGRMFLFALGSAALFTLNEWSRSRIFPWNGLEITQYQNIALIQLAAITGSYGVAFLVAFFNTSAFCSVVTRFKGGGRIVFLAAMGLWALCMLCGHLCSVGNIMRPTWFPLLIQGDLTQRRHPKPGQAEEALWIYYSLTAQALKSNPECDVVIWPESAIPLLYSSNHSLSKLYRDATVKLARTGGKPLLIGAIDFDNSLAGEPGVTNSALLIGTDGKVARKYDKIHRVPWGEYIPGRRFLPQKLVEAIDMGRDLVPGTDFTPIDMGKGIRAGTAVCFEGVFGYVTRNFALRGANVLVVISNDAWYPKSSEPEQHLANAVMRAVETGLPMVRCGNNGGSLVVTRDGRITQVLEVPGTEKRLELRRGRGFRQVAVRVIGNPRKTFYVRFGEWFIGVIGIIVLTWVLFAISEYRKNRLSLLEKMEE
jgi:apolipoprotein N-acyltransferase